MLYEALRSHTQEAIKVGTADVADYASGPKCLYALSTDLPGVLDLLSSAKVYKLDDRAARYINQLNEALELPFNVEETDLDPLPIEWHHCFVPREIIWIEFSLDALLPAHFHHAPPDNGEPADSPPLIGFLIDNRSDHWLHISSFTLQMGELYQNFPSICSAYKHHDNRPDKFSDELKPWGNLALGIAETLFGMLHEKSGASPRRNAQDYVRVHRNPRVLEMPDTLTVRIGPVADAKLSELSMRQGPERRENYAMRFEHWVRPHQRRLPDGRIVPVRGHSRGHPVEPGTPTLVKGPSAA